MQRVVAFTVFSQTQYEKTPANQLFAIISYLSALLKIKPLKIFKTYYLTCNNLHAEQKLYQFA